jgi:hypothetical protein
LTEFWSRKQFIAASLKTSANLKRRKTPRVLKIAFNTFLSDFKNTFKIRNFQIYMPLDSELDVLNKKALLKAPSNISEK